MNTELPEHSKEEVLHPVAESLGANPVASIVLANWNQSGLLVSCLKSISRLRYKEFEVVVVDNGSVDDSIEMVRRHFPDTKVIELDNNTGFAHATNIGIRQSNSDYVVTLNNDIEVDDRWLGELIAALESEPDIGFCASKQLIMQDAQLADACGDFYTIEGIAGKIGHKQAAGNYSDRREVFGGSAGSAIYRREMLEQIGLFDEDFFITHEDTDLSFRAQLQGNKCQYVPSAIVYHQVSASLGEDSDRHIYYGHRNIEFVYWKNMPTPLLLWYLPVHLLTVGLFFMLYIRRGKARPFMRAKIDALRMLPRMLQKRRKIQRSRRVSSDEINQILVRGWLKAAVRRKLASWLAVFGFDMAETVLPEHYSSNKGY